MCLGLAGIYLARNVLVPFLMAAVIAYTLNPIVAALERRGIARGVGALVVLSGLTVALAGVMAAIVPEVVHQVRQFVDRLPGYGEALIAKVEPVEAYLRESYPEQLEALKARALETARGFLPALAGWAISGLKSVMGSAVSLIIGLLTVVVVPVFAYYLLADAPQILATVTGLIPGRLGPQAERRMAEIDQVLRAWLKGQLTVAVSLAVIYAIGLSILGVPLGILIGVVGGLANLVPYLGLVVGFIPAALLSFLETGGWTAPVMVAGVFIFGQILEGTVISPRVVGAGLGMPPALVLLSVLVGGELFGFTGLLLAVPVTAAGLVMLKGGGLRGGGLDSATSGRRGSRPALQRRRPIG
jgi:predicted PurR-regulated permease PerM